MTRNKVKLAFIESFSKRKISYYKRLKGFLNKIHELSILCDVELVVIIYSPFHDEPKVFPNHDDAINTCSKFREFSEFEKSEKMVTQEEFTKQSIKKIKKKLQKVKKENRVSELTNKIYELLNGKDIPVGMHPNDLNDLSYVINQNLKKICEVIKPKVDEENPTSNASKPIVGLMESSGSNSEGPRAPLLVPSSASILVAPLTVPDGTNFHGIMTPMLVPVVDPISMSPFATLSNISSISSTHITEPIFDLVTPTVPQPMMAPLSSVPVSPQIDPSMTIPHIGSPVSMNNHQNYSVGFPQSPALSELFDWLLDDSSFDDNNAQDPNQNNNNF